LGGISDLGEALARYRAKTAKPPASAGATAERP
jgi:hypothetical protein